MYSGGWTLLLLIEGILTGMFVEWFGEKLIEFSVGLRVPPITITTEEIIFCQAPRRVMAGTIKIWYESFLLNFS